MSEEAPATPVAEPSTPATPALEAAPAPAPEQPAQAPATAPVESATNNYFTNEQLAEMLLKTLHEISCYADIKSPSGKSKHV